MKKFVFAIAVVSVVMAGACKKKPGPIDVPSAKPDTSIAAQITMSALINARQWKTDSSYSYRVRNSANDTLSYNLMIVATRIANNEISTINLCINDFKGKGSYPINPPVNTATYYNGNMRHYALSGNITITADTGRLFSGTFSFGADTVNVLDGRFKVAQP